MPPNPKKPPSTQDLLGRIAETLEAIETNMGALAIHLHALAGATLKGEKNDLD